MYQISQTSILHYRYTDTMRWAVAGVFRNAAAAEKGRARLKHLMRAETTFLVTLAVPPPREGGAR